MARSLNSPDSRNARKRFIADAMLGRLARWLRILGYDTLYQKKIEDLTLVRIAREEKRWALTRDRHLVHRRWSPPVRFLLIESDHLPEQLRQVALEFRLKIRPRLMSRCVYCNRLLLPADRCDAEGFVPAYVAVTHKTFMRCPFCNRFYWKGSHKHRMQEELTRWLA
jgi:uncharacterized protein with PIN domain